MEILKVPSLEREKEEVSEDEIEVSLELSIGGSYGKPKVEREKRDVISVMGNYDNGISRSDFSCVRGDVGAENGCGYVDLRKRIEIQALRRQEARKKREEKLSKSRGLNLNGGGDEVILEAQRFQARVLDREARERNGVSARRKEKNGGNGALGDLLSFSLFTEEKTAFRSEKMQTQCLSVERCENEENVLSQEARRSWAAPPCDGSTEQNSPAVSDYQSTSQKGGTNSDTSNHSSGLDTNQDQSLGEPIPDNKHIKVISPTTNPHLHSDTSKKCKTDTDQSTETNNTCSTTENPSSPPPSKEIKHKPPKPPNRNNKNNNVGVSRQHMPCVSTTANGKTTHGFLYRYTKNEVSILCVCHGSSFSPEGFVEHAGCVDVPNPLRHITVNPSSVE